jgi:hypothetical protein
MVFGVSNASGVAGTDYSTAAVGGSLTIGANSSSPFTVEVVSFNPMTNSQGLATFDSSQNYSWTLVSTGGGVVSFDPTAFVIDASGFQNPTGTGGFYLSESGNNLMLNFTPVPEPSEWALMASGLCALGAAWRRRRR